MTSIYFYHHQEPDVTYKAILFEADLFAMYHDGMFLGFYDKETVLSFIEAGTWIKITKKDDV